MEKELIKRLITEKQREIPKTALIKTTIIIRIVGQLCFVGLRRAGKSYLMYQ